MFKNINIEYKDINDKEVIMYILLKNKIEKKYKISIGYDTNELLSLKINFNSSNILNTFGNINNKFKITKNNKKISNIYKKYLNNNEYIMNNLYFEKETNKEFEINILKTIIKYSKKKDKKENNYYFTYSTNKVVEDEKIDLYNISTIGYKFIFNNIKKDKNNIIPLDGYKFLFNTEYGNKYIGSDYNFIKLSTKISFLIKLHKYNNLFIKSKYIKTFSLNKKPIPNSYLIPVGGSFSNRGINYESYFAEELIEENIELNTRINKDIFISNFFDYSLINKKTTISSIGIGVRYITKIGTFKLDFAQNLDNKKNIKKIKINFGYGYDF